MCSPPYLIEMCILGSREPEATLLSLKAQEAGQQPFSNLQVIAVESGGCLGDVTELVGKFLFHDGVQFGLIPLQRIKLNMQTATTHENVKQNNFLTCILELLAFNDINMQSNTIACL